MQLVSSPIGATVQAIDNCLLRALPMADRLRLQPHLELVNLPAGASISPRDHHNHVYFPIAASVSMVHTTLEGDSADSVAVGREGMVGIEAVLGGGLTGSDALVRLGGHAFRMSGSRLKSEFQGNAAVMDVVLRYTQALMMHTAQSALCNQHHSIEQRLCRCLLECLDRAGAPRLQLTHESLAGMLGVRREGVTVAALKLQRDGLIDYSRGRVTVSNRAGIEARSCECYDAIRSLYERLWPQDADCDLPQLRNHTLPHLDFERRAVRV